MVDERLQNAGPLLGRHRSPPALVERAATVGDGTSELGERRDRDIGQVRFVRRVLYRERLVAFDPAAGDV